LLQVAVLAGPRLKACFLEVLFLRPLGTSLPVSKAAKEQGVAASLTKAHRLNPSLLLYATIIL